MSRTRSITPRDTSSSVTNSRITDSPVSSVGTKGPAWPENKIQLSSVRNPRLCQDRTQTPSPGGANPAAQPHTEGITSSRQPAFYFQLIYFFASQATQARLHCHQGVIQKLEAEQHLLPSGSSDYRLAPPPHQLKSRLGLEQRLISSPVLLLSSPSL